MNDPISVGGEVIATLLNRDGSVAYQSHGHNLVVDGGLLQFARLIGGATGAGPVVSMQCGAGTTWPAPPGQLTDLASIPGTSILKTLTSGDITYPTAASGQAKVQFQATWAEGENNFTIWETALKAAGNLLIARYVHPNPGIAKQNTHTLVLQYILTFQAV